ncbi:hypothetical protein JCM10295v2_005792 [Rhodotorula toruloides]
MARRAWTAWAVIAASASTASAQSQPQPTPCFRWSGQAALANSPSDSTGNGTSTLWYYGGEAMTSQGQTNNLWTNALVSLPVDQDWDTGAPPLKLVQKDTGNYSYPPAVALGALWASSDGNKLYQWGGQFQDTPSVPPPEARTFVYDIPSNQWSVVQTQGDQVGYAAEGQPAIVPGLGANGDNLAFYSYGHQDDHTTQGWSNQIARIYLSSMIQFDLGSQTFKNITSFSGSGNTSNASTPESNPLSRADGTLSYVPNLGTDKKGILVSIGGATSTQYVEDGAVLDVYDIGSGGWTKQSTLGARPGSRINHCAVRASAKVHGVETHHIIIYGGQQLNQTARDSAIYILTIQNDTYTWTYVGDNLPGAPAGRAGHQCALSGNQLVVMGGLTKSDVLCEQPGIFVLNTSSTTWQNNFKSGTIFSTPSLVANITGGIGTGYSSSGAGSATGGNGTNDPDTSGKTGGSSGSGAGGAAGGANGGSTNGGGTSGGGGGSSTNIGAIVGGVVGGLAALALLALILFLLARRKKRRNAAGDVHEKERFAMGASPGRSDSGSSSGRFGFPYEKHRDSVGSGAPFPPYGWDRRGSGSGQGHVGPADDDVEEQTRGLDTFISTGLAPKRELRVVNADDA